jgi:hypothetical protein
MATVGKGFVLLLDLDRVISAGEKDLAAELAANAAAAAAAAGPGTAAAEA